MKRFFAGIMSVCMLLTAFGGCSNKEDSAVSQLEKEPLAISDPEQPTTVVLAEYGNNEERSKALRLIADKYEYDHPNVTIEISQFPEPLEEGKLLLQSETKIDIFEVSDSTASAYIRAGHAVDISKYLDEWRDGYTISIAAKWAIHYYDRERAFFIPSAIYSKTLYYRSDLLEKANLPIPRFFHSVESTGLQMMENNETKYGLVLPLSENNRYQLADYFIWSNVGMDQIADIGNAYFVEDGSSKTIFSLPEAEEALETLKQFYQSMGPENALEMGDEEVARIFADGDAFMVVADSRGVNICEEALADEDWVAYPLPLGTADLGVFSNGYQGWSISNNSDCEEVASAFALYLSNVDNTTHLARLTKSIPIHSDAIELDSYFSDSHFSGYQLLADRAAIGLYHYVQQPKRYEAFQAYEAEINNRYEAFFNDEIDAKALLAELDAYWSKAYEDEGQLWESAVEAESSEASDS